MFDLLGGVSVSSFLKISFYLISLSISSYLNKAYE